MCVCVRACVRVCVQVPGGGAVDGAEGVSVCVCVCVHVGKYPAVVPSTVQQAQRGTWQHLSTRRDVIQTLVYVCACVCVRVCV